MSKKEEVSFEKAIEQLEQIVNKLEDEELSLEQSMEYYEEGMKLSKQCSDMLKTAQDKLTHILNEQDEAEPFEVGEE